MNRQKHKLSRRILAVLLMAAMLITMLPSAMFAQDGTSQGGGSSITVSNANDWQTKSDVSFSKTATQVDGDTWDVTMQVTPNQKIDAVPLDVVLVLDISNSMGDRIQGETKMTSAKKCC